MLRAATSLVAPPLCAVCAASCRRDDILCTRCGQRLARCVPARALVGGELEVVTAAPYVGVAREIVARLKFAGRLALAEVAAERMVRAWGATRGACLVPVPAAPARRRIRGFDLAAALADGVAARAPGSFVSSCLVRADGPRQVGRSRELRLGDRPRVRLPPSEPAPAADVWIVDDVATTGATLLSCAEALRAGGATRVRGLTFALADS